MIIREVSHVEVGEDNATIKLHHPDGYVTGILLEPSQPFPVVGTVAIEVGRVTYQDADGKSHSALQHAPALETWKRTGAALAAMVFDRLNRHPWGRRVLGSPALTERLIALHQRGQETTQAHIEHWWQSAPERHRPRVEPVE